MPASRLKVLLASLLAIVWLGAMLAAFWWFEARYIRPFDERTELFSGAALRLPAELAGPGAIRVVHFWDPACPCNVGNQQHLAELLQTYVPRGVQFYGLQKAGSQGQLPENLRALQPLAALAGSEQLPASPAVAIWDQQGQRRGAMHLEQQLYRADPRGPQCRSSGARRQQPGGRLFLRLD
jgi:hypothetical protein